MDDPQKHKIFLGLVIGIIVLAIATFSSCSTAYRQKVARDQEMVARLDMEEKMNKLAQEEQTRNNNIKKIQQAMDDERVQHQKTKEALVREQLLSQGLREELQKRQQGNVTGSDTEKLAQQPAAVPAADQQ